MIGKLYRPFLFGTLSFLFSAFVVTISKSLLEPAMVTIIIAPIAEESIKSIFSSRFPNDSQHQKVKLGLQSGFIFGIIESLVYSSKMPNLFDALYLFGARMLTTVPLHAFTFGIDSYAVTSKKYWFIGLSIVLHMGFNTAVMLIL